MKRNILVIVLLASLMFLLGFTVQSKPQWEYKFVLSPTEKKTNQLAAEGWELTAVDSSSDNLPTFVFKRSR